MALTWNVKREITSNVLPFFFKSICNYDNASPLTIPLKFLAMPSFDVNSINIKVELNLKSRHNNVVV